MRKAIGVTGVLSVVTTAALLLFKVPGWCAGLWLGAAWGLANFWCMGRAARCVVEARRGLRLAGWVVVKFVGLYG